MNKTISLLATGDEIISGDIQDSNTHQFASAIAAQGGDIYQRVQCADNQADIVAALRYLLNHSSAVVITGGLGPTSDDKTRYAVAELTGHTLQVNEDAWQHIVTRLQRFQLTVNAANHQQALLPKDATLYPNPNGSAYGYHVMWQQHAIFVLPGPPSECMSMFTQHVLPRLAELQLLHTKVVYRWLTLGFIESHIAPQIDTCVQGYAVRTGYRWCYPYLEIKLVFDAGHESLEAIAKVAALLQPAVVSTNGEYALAVLAQRLAACVAPITVCDELTQGELARVSAHPALSFQSTLTVAESDVLLHAWCSEPQPGIVQLHSQGYRQGVCCYQHTLQIPNRGAADLQRYGVAYLAWQLSRFITNTLGE